MMILCITIVILYAIKIFEYSIGWNRIKPLKKNIYKDVSIVIALRNEEKEVDNLVKSLKNQTYPVDRIQFILVNDHSTDSTLSLLEKVDLNNLEIVNMPDGEFGKKSSILRGIQKATGEIILASDADCIFSSNWVSAMVSYFSDDEVMLVSGPVAFNKENSVFNNFQALEFTSLIGSGAGAIGINNPIFCNGANMAYRKDVFLEVNNFEKDSAVSGDDVFLLHSIKKSYDRSIAFAKDKDAIVYTKSVNTIKEFFNQRKRWTAKSIGYKDWTSIYTSFLVLFVNVIGLFLIGILFFDMSYINYVIGYFSAKFLIDLYFLSKVLNFFNRKDLIKWILPFEIVYSFYIVLIVFLSFINTFEWKGRIHKR